MIILSFDIGIKNLAYCLMKVTKEEKTIIDWKVINLQCKKQLDLIDEIFTWFDYIKGDIDRVIIEKQPSINHKMCIIANTIASYYIFHCIDVAFISSKRKTKESTKKLTYNQRKKYTIARCLMELSQYGSTWIDHFNSHVKKDDLADCFIQLINYIKDCEI